MSEMLDDILSLENISLAVAKVCSNKGAGGVDGMDVEKNTMKDIILFLDVLVERTKKKI